VSGYGNDEAVGAFESSREVFESITGELAGEACGAMTHGALEQRLTERCRELMRRLLQDHLDLRAVRECPVPGGVTGADGVERTRVERDHRRGLATVFGEVGVTRLAYRAPGVVNVYPADGVLNLPCEKYSHGLRRLAAIEAARGSFADAQAAIARVTGQALGKRQVEELAGRAVADFEAFYQTRKPPSASGEDVLVLSADGKGIVVRPEALREATRKKTAGQDKKLGNRLSKGEKRNRKRLAEVGAVYDITPQPRTPGDILTGHDGGPDTTGPVATSKWLTASITADAAGVLRDVFAEATRRDPQQERTWIALVDGNNHQLDRIQAEAHARGIEVTILVDVIHVLEHLWKAAWCFFDEADPAAENWIHAQAQRVLEGHATRVAGLIRATATRHRLTPHTRKNADATAKYLTRKAHAGHLDYPRALTQGWPIATGVIEGACRHLIADRLDITGARWGLPGAETILKLRALTSNNDLDDYWTHHLTQEQHRNHPTTA
jgi:hypothetical protein